MINPAVQWHPGVWSIPISYISLKLHLTRLERKGSRNTKQPSSKHLPPFSFSDFYILEGIIKYISCVLFHESGQMFRIIPKPEFFRGFWGEVPDPFHHHLRWPRLRSSFCSQDHDLAQPTHWLEKNCLSTKVWSILWAKTWQLCFKVDRDSPWNLLSFPGIYLRLLHEKAINIREATQKLTWFEEM